MGGEARLATVGHGVDMCTQEDVLVWLTVKQQVAPRAMAQEARRRWGEVWGNGHSRNAVGAAVKVSRLDELLDCFQDLLEQRALNQSCLKHPVGAQERDTRRRRSRMSPLVGRCGEGWTVCVRVCVCV
jgi:hypothetical protein